MRSDLPPHPQVYHARYTHRADIFSFGMLLWETVHVERPFRGMSAVDVATAVTLLRKRPPLTPAPQPDGGFRSGMQALMGDCWQQESPSRPEMTDVVARLRALADTATDAPIFCARVAGDATRSRSVSGPAEGLGGIHLMEVSPCSGVSTTADDSVQRDKPRNSGSGSNAGSSGLWLSKMPWLPWPGAAS